MTKLMLMSLGLAFSLAALGDSVVVVPKDSLQATVSTSDNSIAKFSNLKAKGAQGSGPQGGSGVSPARDIVNPKKTGKTLPTQRVGN